MVGPVGGPELSGLECVVDRLLELRLDGLPVRVGALGERLVDELSVKPIGAGGVWSVARSVRPGTLRAECRAIS